MMSDDDFDEISIDISLAYLVAKRRIEKELKEHGKEPAPLLSYAIEPRPEHPFLWEAKIEGPEDSPYAGGLFTLSILFPPFYPFLPPRVMFKTKVFHPNIYGNGRICLDILDEEWTPAITISKVLLLIGLLLIEPNPDDPFEPEIAHLYKTDKAKYEEIARSWTQKFAKH